MVFKPGARKGIGGVGEEGKVWRGWRPGGTGGGWRLARVLEKNHPQKRSQNPQMRNPTDWWEYWGKGKVRERTGLCCAS